MRIYFKESYACSKGLFLFMPCLYSFKCNMSSITKTVVKIMYVPLQITVYLEQKSYKELRAERYGSVKVVMAIYRKVICSCQEQL